MKNPEIRRVFKKGRYVLTRKGSFVIALSKKIYFLLKPLSKRIEIAGSIRRKSKAPVDVDIVLIAKNKDEIVQKLSELGKYVSGGEKRSTFKIQGVKVEIAYANNENWGAMLMAYTGPSGANIGLRIIAKRKGLLLNQYGLFKGKRHIAGRTEKSIYEALGKKYKVPEER